MFPQWYNHQQCISLREFLLLNGTCLHKLEEQEEKNEGKKKTKESLRDLWTPSSGTYCVCVMGGQKKIEGIGKRAYLKL